MNEKVEEPISWSEPDFGEEVIQAASNVLKTGWLTQGQVTKEFETELSKFFVDANVVAVNSGSSALIMALQAHGIGPGDEVIIPSFTFIATLTAILAVGAKPVLVDCDVDTYNTTPEIVNEAISEKTRAIMPVDVYGMPVDIHGFEDIASDNGILFIEDAAEAMGALYKQKRIGSFDHTTVFSFHAAKLISTIEGGCVATRNKELAQKMSLIRNHGMEKKYIHEMWGYNFRTTDVQSAIGLAQLKKIEEYLSHRNALVKQYKKRLTDFKFQYVPNYVDMHPYMIFGFQTDRREKIIDAFNSNRIGYRICWQPIHLQPFIKDKLEFSSFPNAEEIFETILNAPIGNTTTLADVNRVCDTILASS